jgi:TonB-linked SusC/RagA family outer membrane protein
MSRLVKNFDNLSSKFASVLLCMILYGVAYGQETTISGTVRSGEDPLPGVSVRVTGTTKSTTTNEQGMFQVTASKGQSLVFTYLGFQEQSILVAEDTVINVSLLSAGVNDLNEVVVVGYGTKRKVNLTGAVATVGAKQLEDRPVSNVASALQGTMSGVTVVNNSGQPGRDQGNIRVRGIGTLNNSDAMVVVDGVISSLNDVNVNDIESISVLKDAASAAIYGSRASNGVILVTTKKGKSGEMALHYNMYVGQQRATRLPDFVNSWEAGTFYNEALANEGKNPRYTPEEIQKFRDGSDPDNYPNTDWLDLFYNGSGFQQSHYLDISGGTEKTQTLASLGYFAQDGIIKHTALDRYTSRFKITSKLNPRLLVNANVAFNLEQFKEPTNPYTKDFAGMIWQINRIGRNVPYKYSNGYYGYYDDGNPMAWLETESTNDNTAYYLRGNVDADLEIIKGLHFKPLLGYRLDLNQSKTYIKDIQYYDWRTGDATFYQGPNSLTDFNNNTSVITLQALLQYDRIIGKHDVKLFAGYSQEFTHYSYLQGFRKGFLNNSLTELDAGPLTGQQANGSGSDLALQSVFGRLNYSFNERYLLEANMRYDGSSRFAPNNRWGLYPSFSAAWRISEETFFKSLKGQISELKIRGSWGKLGNQNIAGNYPYIPTIASGQNYSFGGGVASGVAPVYGANTDIVWEDTESSDIGLDATLLGNKISLTADYFIRNTNNILINIPVGAAYGFNPPVQNAGSVKNKGLEIDLAYRGGSDRFTYSVSANASFIKNTVTDLKGTDPIISGFTFMKVGYPVNSLYGYESEGIFQTQAEIDAHATQSGGTIGPGDLKYKDQNGDNVINGADRVYLGSFFPKATYGLNIVVNWNNFDLNIFMQGSGGLKNLLVGEVMGIVSDKYGKPTSIFQDHWSPSNTGSGFPRLWSSYTQNDPSINTSSFWVRNAGYIRLKNLQVGYTLPTKALLKIGVKKARLYYSGQNIVTFSNFYDWVDPETPAGERGTTYPQVYVNTIGLNITF